MQVILFKSETSELSGEVLWMIILALLVEMNISIEVVYFSV
jgi:hypothetical protein